MSAEEGNFITLKAVLINVVESMCQLSPGDRRKLINALRGLLDE
jgi:hypothetical protein